MVFVKYLVHSRGKQRRKCHYYFLKGSIILQEVALLAELIHARRTCSCQSRSDRRDGGCHEASSMKHGIIETASHSFLLRIRLLEIDRLRYVSARHSSGSSPRAGVPCSESIYKPSHRASLYVFVYGPLFALLFFFSFPFVLARLSALFLPWKRNC